MKQLAALFRKAVTSLLDPDGESRVQTLVDVMGC
jgi:hypothetical protein